MGKYKKPHHSLAELGAASIRFNSIISQRIGSVETPYKRAENQLRKYFKGELQQQLKNRRLELEFPPKQADELGVKVQTSQKGESPQESLYERLENDRKLKLIERKIGIIENFVNNAKEIRDGEGYEVLYLYDYKRYTWRQVEARNENQYSETTCKRIRRELLMDLTDKLSVLDNIGL